MLLAVQELRNDWSVPRENWKFHFGHNAKVFVCGTFQFFGELEIMQIVRRLAQAFLKQISHHRIRRFDHAFLCRRCSNVHASLPGLGKCSGTLIIR